MLESVLADVYKKGREMGFKAPTAGAAGLLGVGGGGGGVSGVSGVASGTATGDNSAAGSPAMSVRKAATLASSSAGQMG